MSEVWKKCSLRAALLQTEHPNVGGVWSMAERGNGRALTSGHKAALAEGRAQGRAVRAYLEALETHRPRPGRKRTPETMRRRLEQIEAELANADPLRRLQLVQERLDLSDELAATRSKVDVAALEREFVAAARAYSERKRISYAAWRELGVPAATLRRAGVTRSASARLSPSEDVAPPVPG